MPGRWATSPACTTQHVKGVKMSALFERRATWALCLCLALAACGGAEEANNGGGAQAPGGVASGAGEGSAGGTAGPAASVLITAQPQSQQLTVGGDALFTVQASASTGAPLSYQWLRDGEPLAGETGATLMLKGVQKGDDGALISVRVNAGTLSSLSEVAQLSVSSPSSTAYPIMFVTSVPSIGFTHQLNTFGNHGTGTTDAVAGGDLMVRYPDGSLRNLTKEAGWGVDSGGIQGGAKAISVRQPTMHWDGKKALFSMLVGGPSARFQVPQRNWQIYEVSGLGQGETVRMSKVAQQPAGYNNISPIYGSDDSILFISDAPLNGMTHTYPQLDEYESTITNTGIWKLDRSTGKVSHLQHAPSGVFDLFLDSHGRVLFTKWDHLVRDQQADADRYDGGGYGSIDYENEAATTPRSFPARDAKGKLLADSRGVLYELFPQPRTDKDPTKEPDESIGGFNQFFIWQINEDGSGEETINHAGRHDFGGGYQGPSFAKDPNLSDAMPSYVANVAMRGTFRGDAGVFQLREDVNRPGVYIGTYALEFARQASGRIIEFRLPPGMNPEDLVVVDHTNATLDADPLGAAPPKATMTGHYRSPLYLSDGSILVSHTKEYRLNGPASPYLFQLKKLVANPFGSDKIAGESLTGGIVKEIRYWTDDAEPRQYKGLLNEHDAVEVRGRPRPVTAKATVADVEKKVLGEEGVNEAELRAWLQNKGLALIVSRNVTLRDRADVSQPYNLRVPQGVQNVVKQGTVYDVSGLQIFQADLTRGYGNGNGRGRRVFARPVHNNSTHADVASWYPTTTEPEGTVKLGKDGSMAAFVPAGRALSWQLVSPTGKPIVRERIWVSFAPGEIRTCASCHGVNKATGNGLAEPSNPPEALRDLVRNWKARQ